MTDTTTVFAPLIGRLVWQVKRGVGSMLTMEFGEPHLRVHEPVEPLYRRSPKVVRLQRRRRVFPKGDWHFWIEYAAWKITTANFSLDSDAPIGGEYEECL